MASLQEMADEYFAARLYHNSLIQDIEDIFFNYDGVNPLQEIKTTKEKIKSLEESVPEEMLDKSIDLLEFTDETIKKLPQKLQESWGILDKSKEKLFDLLDNYHYLIKHYPKYNVCLVIMAEADKYSKAHSSYVKNLGLPRDEEIGLIQEKIEKTQAKRVKSEKILDDHKKFESFKNKYPKEVFDRELSEAELKVLGQKGRQISFGDKKCVFSIKIV